MYEDAAGASLGTGGAAPAAALAMTGFGLTTAMSIVMAAAVAMIIFGVVLLRVSRV